MITAASTSVCGRKQRIKNGELPEVPATAANTCSLTRGESPREASAYPKPAGGRWGLDSGNGVPADRRWNPPHSTESTNPHSGGREPGGASRCKENRDWKLHLHEPAFGRPAAVKLRPARPHCSELTRAMRNLGPDLRLEYVPDGLQGANQSCPLHRTRDRLGSRFRRNYPTKLTVTGTVVVPP
jgi:hypothetical protein